MRQMPSHYCQTALYSHVLTCINSCWKIESSYKKKINKKLWVSGHIILSDSCQLSRSSFDHTYESWTKLSSKSGHTTLIQLSYSFDELAGSEAALYTVPMHSLLLNWNYVWIFHPKPVLVTFNLGCSITSQQIFWVLQGVLITISTTKKYQTYSKHFNYWSLEPL